MKESVYCWKKGEDTKDKVCYQPYKSNSETLFVGLAVDEGQLQWEMKRSQRQFSNCLWMEHAMSQTNTANCVHEFATRSISAGSLATGMKHCIEREGKREMRGGGVSSIF